MKMPSETHESPQRSARTRKSNDVPSIEAIQKFCPEALLRALDRAAHPRVVTSPRPSVDLPDPPMILLVGDPLDGPRPVDVPLDDMPPEPV